MVRGKKEDAKIQATTIKKIVKAPTLGTSKGIKTVSP